MQEPDTLAIAANASQAESPACELSIVMPCLNEHETLGKCIDKANSFIMRGRVLGEVLIADNGSTDGSQEIARAHGARVTQIAEKGYGSALKGAIAQAHGRYVIMGDSDDSYDFSQLDAFLEALRGGIQLVMGNRFSGGIRPGAMPWLHRRVGNPVLTAIGRLFFRAPVRDFHCGLRGFDRAAIRDLDLRTTGMEFASEMVVKATLKGLWIKEVPTTLTKDGRTRAPHLRSWRDGWRHLRFLMLHCPRWLFLYPGIALFLAGVVLMAVVLPAPLQLGSVVFDVHSLVVAMALALVGFQTILFFLLSKQFACNEGLLPEGSRFRFYRSLMSTERALLLGGCLSAGGMIGLIWAVVMWGAGGFGPLDYSWMMRLVVPSVMAIILGIQIVFGGLLAGVLDLTLKREPEGRPGRNRSP